MSDRTRSRLFGRPSELLVDELAPRINMPPPPPVRVENERTDPAFSELDEEDSAPVSGPLQVFVGAPGRMPPKAAVPPNEASPGALMTDAIDQLGSALGRRPESASLPRATTGASVGGGIRVSLRVGSARVPAHEVPVAVQQRGQGIATASARVRVAKVEALPSTLATFDDEEQTSGGFSPPFEVFEVPRGADERSDPLAPAWDDPRFRRAEALAGAGSRPVERGAPDRIPTFDEITREALPPGLAPAPADGFGSATLTDPTEWPALTTSSAERTPPPIALPTPPPFREPPPQPLHPRPVRPQLVAAALVFCVVLGGIYAWRWVKKSPGVFGRSPLAVASLPPTVPPPTTPVVPAIQVAAPLVEGVTAPAEGARAPEVAPAEVVPVLEAPPVPPVAVAPPVAVVPATPATPIASVEERRGAFELATGVLHVACNRKATVYVDNVKVGTTADGRPFELVAGTHRVKLVASNGRSRTQEVRIDAGRTSMLKFELR